MKSLIDKEKLNKNGKKLEKQKEGKRIKRRRKKESRRRNEERTFVPPHFLFCLSKKKNNQNQIPNIKANSFHSCPHKCLAGRKKTQTKKS